MIYDFEQCSAVIEEQLKKLAIGQKKPVNLYEPVVYVLDAGGKRIRPALTLMACNLFNDNIRQALMPAIALEVFHNFTLMHDDVMDKADVRRNRPTVHKRWSESTAILSGDAMMILAYQYLCQSQPDILPSLLEIFSRTALEVCEGQQYDMDFESRMDVSIDEYLHMIRRKTAVLLAASLKMGALCGGSDTQNAELLYRFGISLGLTFQIQDDWLDVYADPKVFGKAIGGDILSRKKTYLLLTAFEKAGDEDRTLLSALLLDDGLAPEKKIQQVKSIYERLNVGDIAREAMASYDRQAMEYLQQVKLPDESRKNELKKLAKMLLGRAK